MENNIIQIIKEPIFWIFTAVGSVVLSICANLLTPLVQKYASKYSNEKREIQIKEKLKIRDTIIKIHESDTYRISWQIESVLLCIKGTGSILLFLIILNAISVFPIYPFDIFIYPIIALASVVGFNKIQRGINNANLVKLADEREQAIIKSKTNKGADLNSSELIAVLNKWDLENLGVNSKFNSEQSLSADARTSRG
jgi:hypothetical protein